MNYSDLVNRYMRLAAFMQPGTYAKEVLEGGADELHAFRSTGDEDYLDLAANAFNKAEAVAAREMRAA